MVWVMHSCPATFRKTFCFYNFINQPKTSPANMEKCFKNWGTRNLSVNSFAEYLSFTVINGSDERTRVRKILL